MECCGKDNKADGEKKYHETNSEGGIKMEKKIILWLVIGALIVVVLYILLKGQAGPAAGAATAAAGYGGMVGGC